MTWIEELQYTGEDHDRYNQEVGEAIMTDDGGPTRESERSAFGPDRVLVMYRPSPTLLPTQAHRATLPASSCLLASSRGHPMDV